MFPVKNRWGWCAYGLIFIGALVLLKGAWIPAKAALAQVLLERAWQETLLTQQQIKPWPWADTWPIAKLSCERLGVHLVVLEGASGEVLAFGPGHQPDTVLPAASGNSVIVGHRDTSFSFLRNIQQGDLLLVENRNGKKMEYLVQQRSIKNADALYLASTQEPWLTLITCYPFDALTTGGEQRFLVFAEKKRENS